MTQYMLSVHHDGLDDVAFQMSAEDQQATFEAVDAVNAEMVSTGAWVFGGGLELPTSATTVRAHEGDTLITDGPFAETKEFLGGFWVIEAPDLDAALTWAKKASAACRGPVEVRPFQAEPEA
jgi:hypothetical protein